jgi:hypothetical protein
MPCWHSAIQNEAMVGLAILAAIELGLGLLARRLHAWVNHVIAILSLLQLVCTFLSAGSDRAGPRPEAGAAWLGIFITAALLERAGRERLSSPSGNGAEAGMGTLAERRGEAAPGSQQAALIAAIARCRQKLLLS